MCKEQFGQNTTHWFTPEAVEEARTQVYDQAINTIEDDETNFNKGITVVELFRDHTTEVERRYVQANRETLPQYDTGFNSDTSFDDESDSKLKTVFYLRMLFQLKPTSAEASGMDNHNSI